MIAPVETTWRAEGQQVDVHLLPVTVCSSEENVLVQTAKVITSVPRTVLRVSTFLGVMPGDIVEMAVDVESKGGAYIYARSIHKETSGIYDAWDSKSADILFGDTEWFVTFTLRVNGPNSDGLDSAFFEGLCRLTFYQNGY